MKNPVHPDKKCCFNCARVGTDCEVWHNCGEDCPGWKNKVVTNADKIRAMTDKDLAISMFVSIDCSVCPCTGKCSNGSGCLDTILNWLQQPAEVDDAENR
jgi:hypothetical protein